MIIVLILLYIHIIAKILLPIAHPNALSHLSTFLLSHMRKTRYLSLYIWLIWISMTSVYLHIPPHGVVISVITTEQNSMAHI